MRTINDIIEAAGGVDAVASGLSDRNPKPVTRWAVFKWRQNGIPSKHWPFLITAAGASADELLALNEEVMSAKGNEAAA